MLDIKFMRENRDAVLAAMRALAAEDAPVAQALALDERRRAILVRVEVLRAERNSGSKQIGQLMREGKRAEGQALQAHMSAIGDEIKTLDEELAQVEADLQDAMLRIPNLPHPSVPVGASDAENVIVREEGQPRAFDFEPLPHWDLGTKLDIIDFDRGVKLERHALLRVEGRRRAPPAGADHLDARPAHGEARLHRGPPAVHGQGGDAGGHGQPAQVRRQPLPRRRGGLLVDPDGRGAGHQPVPRRDPGRRRSCRSITWPTPPASAARR